MIIDQSTALFPLRTNAHALLAGAPALSVVGRIKHASLLHDRVLLESGSWMANAGPAGSTTFWTPPDQGGEHRWQQARDRRSAQQAGFYLAMAPSGSSQPLRTVIHSDSAEVAWQATMEPVRRELPSEVDWIEFESFGLTSAGKRIVARLVSADVDDDWLTSELRERWSRNLVSKSVAHDLVLANGLAAALSMDNRHALVTEARVRRGEAAVVLGGHAQAVLLPNVSNMSWDDLATVRRDRGLRRLRAVLREVEAEALEGSGSLGELDRRIHAIFTRELAKIQSISTLSPANMAATAIGFVVGEGVGLATAGVPAAGGVVGGAAGALANEAIRRLGSDRWVRTYRRARSG